jgi:ribosomal protein S18 acetylase RimI-like enzyme
MIRRATEGDAAAIARVFRCARTTSLPWLPDLHTPESELRFFRDHVMRQYEVWVAGEVDGFCAFDDGWVEHLYIHPDHNGRGLGSALLDQAKRGTPTLHLWVFQRNVNAIRFYERHGFRIVERTDGRRNEEREPDARMAWTRG